MQWFYILIILLTAYSLVTILPKKLKEYNPAIPTRVYTTLDNIVMSPKRTLTMSNSNIPISPQLIVPTISKIRAI